MGVCVSLDNMVTANGGHRTTALEQQNQTVASSQSTLPYIGGRRLGSREQHCSSPEFTDILRSLPNPTAQAAAQSGFLLVRPSTISSFCNGPHLEATPLSGDSLLQINSGPSSPRCQSIHLVASGDDFTGSSSATRPARMSSSSRRFVRSPRTVSFSSSVLTFTEIPSAPPPSPASAPLPSTPRDAESVMGWDTLQAELRSVAMEQLEGMILSAGRNGEAMSDEIVNSFLELADRELLNRTSPRDLSGGRGIIEATPRDDADDPSVRHHQQQAAPCSPVASFDEKANLSVSASFDATSLVDIGNAHVAKKPSSK